jgi:hypothetical protein
MEWPTFRVTRVDDGVRHGLLLEKTERPGGERQRAYFYFRSGSSVGSLEPSPTIRRCCTCYPLETGTSLELLFSELARYAAEAYAAGKTAVRVKPSGIHAESYPKTASTALGDKSCPFALFFTSAAHKAYDVFKNAVLSSERITHVLEGRAESFRVCPPDSLYLFDEQFEFLETAQQVLEVDNTHKPEWFRRRGPTLCDFEAGRVCSRPAFELLKQCALAEPVSVLVGPTGTGKSVLARCLAYELYAKQRVPLYWCRHRPSVQPIKLLDEIHTVCGIIVLDDAHRDPAIYQEVCRRARTGQNRRIVVVARDSFLTYPHLEEKAPQEWPIIRLKYGDDGEQLLSHCAGAARPLPDSVRDEIGQFAAGNLWLLAYAVRGYADANGKGAPVQWVGARVAKDLEFLRVHLHGDPRALLAVSPLAKHELPTARRFLTDTLELSQAALDRMTLLGELIEDVEHNEIYYGLPHSTLAGVYWEHGRTYGFADEEDEEFFYRYARSCVPNGLRALFRCDRAMADRILGRLARDGKLDDVVAHERDARTITFLICRKGTGDARTRWLAALARRIAVARSADEALYSILDLQDSRLVGDVIGRLEPREFANLISRNTRAYYTRMFLGLAQRFTSPEYQEQILHSLNLRQMADSLMHYGTPGDVIEAIDGLAEWNGDVASALWEHLNKHTLADGLLALPDTGKLALYVCALFHAIPRARHDLFCEAQLHRLRERLIGETDLPSAGQLVAAMNQGDVAGEAPWGVDDLVKGFGTFTQVRSMARCLLAVRRWSEPTVAVVCRWLKGRLRRVAQGVLSSAEFLGIGEFVYALCCCDAYLAREFLLYVRDMQAGHGQECDKKREVISCVQGLRLGGRGARTRKRRRLAPAHLARLLGCCGELRLLFEVGFAFHLHAEGHDAQRAQSIWDETSMKEAAAGLLACIGPSGP